MPNVIHHYKNERLDISSSNLTCFANVGWKQKLQSQGEFNQQQQVYSRSHYRNTETNMISIHNEVCQVNTNNPGVTEKWDSEVTEPKIGQSLAGENSKNGP